MAKADMVVTYRSLSDPKALEAYAKLASPAIQAAGGRILERGMPAKTYEMGMNQRTVVATASPTPAMVSDRFGGPHFGTIVGVGLRGAALGSALGPWMAAGCGLAAGAAAWRARVLRVRVTA